MLAILNCWIYKQKTSSFQVTFLVLCVLIILICMLLLGCEEDVREESPSRQVIAELHGVSVRCPQPGQAGAVCGN